MNKKIILASHGQLADGMRNSVEMIIGDLHYPCKAYCLQVGQNPENFAKEIKDEIERNPDIEYEIVVDLVGASVCTAMYPLTQYKNVHLFTGMNLNLVLSLFVEHPEELCNDSINQIVDDAKSGIKNLDAADNSETDEF